MRNNGYVLGVQWCDNGKRCELVIAGPAKDLRRMMDEILSSLPVADRRKVARYFGPLLEGREQVHGVYYAPFDGTLITCWHKTASVKES